MGQAPRGTAPARFKTSKEGGWRSTLQMIKDGPEGTKGTRPAAVGMDAVACLGLSYEFTKLKNGKKMGRLQCGAMMRPRWNRSTAGESHGPLAPSPSDLKINK